MPHYTPWVTPSPVTVTGRPRVTVGLLVAGDTDGATFNPAVTPPWGITLSADRFPEIDPALDTITYQFAETRWVIDFTPILPQDVPVILTPPQIAAGATVEYDPGDADRVAWVTDPDVTFDVSIRGGQASVLGPPNTVTYLDDTVGAYAYPVTTLTPADLTGWTGPADIPGLTLAGSAPVHGTPGSGASTLTVTLPLSAITRPDVSTWPAAESLLTFLTASHAAGTYPTVPPHGSFEAWNGLQSFVDGLSIVGGFRVLPAVTWTYQPRRWRLVYPTLPPLRQYPRDDALGGAPRQGNANGSTSVQASARQGWRNAYR